MTIATTESAVTGIGNGVTTTFNFSFIMGSAANAVVTYADVNNNFTILNSSQYTLFLNLPAVGQIWGIGGTVTYSASTPIPNGSFLIIDRSVPLTQTTSISGQGAFSPEVIEAALDTLEMQIQQISNGNFALFVTTSVSSIAIATGIQTFIVANSNLAYAPGQYLIASANGSPTNFMIGYVVSYVNTTLVIQVVSTGGGGTYSNWNISVSGIQGSTGGGTVTSSSSSSTDGDVVLWSGITGQAIKDGGNAKVSGNLNVVGTLTVNPGTGAASDILQTENATNGGSLTFAWFPVTPATGLIKELAFNSVNVSSIQKVFANINANALTITAGSETGYFDFYTSISGTLAQRFLLKSGFYATGLTDQGAGTINTTGLYINNTLSNPAFTKAFTSTETTVLTGAQVYTIAHGLGVIPTLVRAVLRCKTAQNGYNIGDEADVRDPWENTGGSLLDVGISVDATNIYLAQANSLNLTDRGTTNNFTITYADWKLVVRAWA